MSYEEIVKITSTLGSKDKLRLANLLTQLAKQEEKASSPDIPKPDIVAIIERIKKNKPTRLKTLHNFIKSMFQVYNNMSDSDVDIIINILKQRKIIAIENNKIIY
jgi:hypothetical protein